MPDNAENCKSPRANMQWFRMYHEFATDPKVQMLSEADQRRYVMLLCLRCSNGHVTLQDSEVAFQLRISDADWLETKARLIDKNLIDDANQPTAWDKRQRRSDTSNERVFRHRERQKAQAKRTCNVTVTPPDTESEKEKEEENTPLTPLSGEKRSEPIDCLKAFEAYNATALRCGLPQAAKLTPQRSRKLRARLKEFGPDGWQQALANLEKSAFLTGQNDTGWRANLDFLLQPSSFAKLHDGAYGNGRHATPDVFQAQREANYRASLQMLDDLKRERQATEGVH